MATDFYQLLAHMNWLPHNLPKIYQELVVKKKDSLAGYKEVLSSGGNVSSRKLLGTVQECSLPQSFLIFKTTVSLKALTSGGKWPRSMTMSL